jgi:hypothetical protein
MPFLKKENWIPSVHSLWLLPVFAAALFLRLYHGWEPAPTYWDDFAIEIIAPRNILDFHAHHWVFDVGRREPFFSYFAALLWRLLPAAKGLVIQRLACVILNLLTLWVLYLAGKELSSRRAGIILAALGAINLDLLVKCLIGIRIASVPLAVSLILLYTLRILRNPNRKHFLQWGLALAFGTYTYTALRVLPLPLVFILWIWILGQTQGEEGQRGQKFLSFLILLVFGFYYALGNNLIKGGLFNDWSLSFKCMGLLFFIALCIYAYLEKKAGMGNGTPALAFWSGGVLLAAVFMVPMLIQSSISEHMAGLSLFTEPLHGFKGFAMAAWKRLLDGLDLLAWKGGDRSDLSPPGTAMVEKTVAALALAGAGFTFLKPDKKGMVLLVLAGAGFLPYLLNSEPHSGKLSCAVVPVLALAVLGIEKIFESRVFQRDNRHERWAALAVLGGLWVWTLLGHVQLVYEKWPAESGNLEVAAYHQLGQDLEDHEVYLGPFNNGAISWESQGVLEEGRKLHPFQESNQVVLGGNDKLQGIMVYLPLGDEEGLKRLSRYHCIVSEVKGPRGKKFFTKVEIPLNEIQKKRKKKDPPFVIVESANGLVHRRFYGIQYGFGRGLARGEDWVSSVNDPMPDWVNHEFGARLDWNLGTSFQIGSSGNPTWWWLDGKFLKSKPGLLSGKHHVECFTLLKQSLVLPEPIYVLPGG